MTGCGHNRCDDGHSTPTLPVATFQYPPSQGSPSCPHLDRARHVTASPLPAWPSPLGLALGVRRRSGVAPAVAADATVTVTGLQTNGRTEPLGIPGDAPSLSWSVGVHRPAESCRAPTRSGSPPARTSSTPPTSGTPARSPPTDQADVVVRRAGPDGRHALRLAGPGRGTAPTRRPAGASRRRSRPASSTPATGATPMDRQVRRRLRSTGGPTTPPTSTSTSTTWRSACSSAPRNVSNALHVADLDVPTAPPPKFRPHKRVNGNYTLLDSKPISSGITVGAAARGHAHACRVTVDGSTITTSARRHPDRHSATTPRSTKGFVGFRPGLRQRAPSTSRPTQGRRGRPPRTATSCSTPTSPTATRSTAAPDRPGPRVAERKDVLWRSPDANKPLLRKEFTTEPGKTIESARVYASAHGVYELELNGEKVGDQLLAPGWTDYRKRIQSQTYDVTDQVRDG